MINEKYDKNLKEVDGIDRNTLRNISFQQNNNTLLTNIGRTKTLADLVLCEIDI